VTPASTRSGPLRLGGWPQLPGLICELAAADTPAPGGPSEGSADGDTNKRPITPGNQPPEQHPALWCCGHLAATQAIEGNPAGAGDKNNTSQTTLGWPPGSPGRAAPLTG